MIDRKSFSHLIMDSCQNVPEFWHFIKFLQAHKENYDNILELGCFKGGSTAAFKELLKPHSKLPGIDLNVSDTMDFTKRKFSLDFNLEFLIADSNIKETAENFYKLIRRTTTIF